MHIKKVIVKHPNIIDSIQLTGVTTGISLSVLFGVPGAHSTVCLLCDSKVHGHCAVFILVGSSLSNLIERYKIDIFIYVKWKWTQEMFYTNEFHILFIKVTQVDTVEDSTLENSDNSKRGLQMSYHHHRLGICLFFFCFFFFECACVLCEKVLESHRDCGGGNKILSNFFSC